MKYWNPSFVIPKAGGKFRKILDCREVNRATEQLHFKIESTQELMEVIQLGDSATILELEKVYLHFRVEENLNNYFDFRFERQDYVFTGFPFGWVRSPAIFCSTLRVAIKTIQEQVGVRLVAYMDDLLQLEQEGWALEENTVREVSVTQGFEMDGGKTQVLDESREEFRIFQMELGVFEVGGKSSKLQMERNEEIDQKMDVAIDERSRRRIREVASLQGELNFCDYRWGMLLYIANQQIKRKQYHQREESKW
ncbi:MAG: hypothetical protein EZS28_045150 [Streblomastix strix]|uniref:Reverse transcriptase domain-containing protein n=1 Tax=Streblomastix strix TaxID=222440 RepID=A0A5J4TLP3_9EUKA|nr:MAG: hypothetical protein EZS28_045150 [Streblomastix strix]